MSPCVDLDFSTLILMEYVLPPPPSSQTIPSPLVPPHGLSQKAATLKSLLDLEMHSIGFRALRDYKKKNPLFSTRSITISDRLLTQSHMSQRTKMQYHKGICRFSDLHPRAIPKQMICVRSFITSRGSSIKGLRGRKS